jgi:glycerol-3-phosphate dehydrogenase
MVGAVRYWDAMVDDARHTLALARTAAAHGAQLASSTKVTGIPLQGGRVAGVDVTDLENGEAFRIEARRVISATGVWSDDIQALVGDPGLDVRASKGIHIVVPRDRIRSGTGLILRTERSVLFVVPWGEHWIIGTTDTPWDLRRAHPAACSDDIDYILRWANSVLEDDLAPEDIVGVYAGLRPLLMGESDDTSKLSREHRVLESPSGLISIAGGKYTTYRVMARDAVDAAVAGWESPVAASRTEEIPLIGAEGFQRLWEERSRLPVEGADRLLRRYGSLALDLLDRIESDRSLGEPLVENAPYLRAEIAYAASDEGALHLDDVLTRRTRLSIETVDRGVEAAPRVAEIVGPILGWDEATVSREIDHYLARVEAELDSQRQPDDSTADAARMGAPDVRTGRSE